MTTDFDFWMSCHKVNRNRNTSILEIQLLPQNIYLFYFALYTISDLLVYLVVFAAEN